MGVKKDLLGMVFTRYTVIKDLLKSKNGKSVWLCRCECGVEKEVTSRDLISGDAKSCGCYHKYILAKRNETPMEIGARYGKLVVLSKAHQNPHGEFLFLCKCDCGNERYGVGSWLRQGHLKSCGCINPIKKKEHIKYHGMIKSNPKEYNTWKAMKTRCYREKGDDYPNYGGRGIIVCDRWLHDPMAFLQDMGVRPTDDHSIERTDVNGNYEPSNCYWGTDDIQANNTRRSVRIVIDGIRYTPKQIHYISGLSVSLICARVRYSRCHR